MATNKNQHFVPRCYLKPFTLDGEGVAINVYNLDRRKNFSNAPLKSQCSSDYFYGRNPTFEPILKYFEGAYAATVRNIGSANYKLTNEDRSVLRLFCFLQWCRTEAAAQQYVKMTSELASWVNLAGEMNVAMTLKEAAVEGVLNFLSATEEVSDLKVCLASNRTSLDFITSDDPAILTNRWYIQNPQAKGVSYGVGNAGAIFYFPLTPRICCIVYDGDVYSMPNSNGWQTIKRTSDVESINEQQFLNCNANIYFRDWASLASLLAAHSSVEGKRFTAWHKLVFAVLDREDEWGARYRVVTAEEATVSASSLVHMQFIRPPPSRWPSIIHWRSSRKVFSNGTGTNFVRRRHTYDRVGRAPYVNVG